MIEIVAITNEAKKTLAGARVVEEIRWPDSEVSNSFLR